MEKVALITGASSGIGREIAKIHAKNGGDCILVARREDKLLELQKELEKDFGRRSVVIVEDLSASGAAQRIFDNVKTQKIEVEYLVNNAGFGGVGKFHEGDIELYSSMIQVNVVALTELTRLFLPEFIERNSGRILNVSSTASLIAGPMQAVYFATKAFVTSLNNAIAEEVRKSNVTVTNLMPGATSTEFGDISGMGKTALFKRTQNSHDVARKGYQGMLKGKMDVVTGFGEGFGYYLINLLPKKLVLRVVMKLQQPS